MTEEIKFSKYEERGATHIKESERSVRRFNAFQQARFDFCLKFLGDIKGKTVLDVGCGDGALTYLLCKTGAEVTGIDSSELGIKFAKEFLASKGFKPKLIVGTSYEIPLPDNSVDFVVSSDVIEHVQYPDKLLAEAKRVLKPGGKIVVSTPYRLTEKPFDKFHVKEFFPSELEDLFSKYFTEVEIKETHEVFWYSLYTHEFNIPRLRRPLRYIINFMSLYLNKNPFMTDDSKRKKWDLYTQLFVIALKKKE